MKKAKRCPKCNEKIKNSPNFCPNCGFKLKEKGDDWGMLGKSDNFLEPNELPFFQGLSGNMLNKLIGGTLKMLEKELQKENSTQKNPQTKIKLVINGKEVSPNKIKQISPTTKENERKLPIEFSEKNLKKWMNSKKQIPKTKLKRIENKIQYEMEIPGVETIEDISILKFEESLEVRAIAKDVAYQKNIPLNLPLKKYTLLKDKLTLELDAS